MPAKAARFPMKPVALWRIGASSALIGGLCAAAHNWLTGGEFAWPKTVVVAAGAGMVTFIGYFLQPTLLQGERLYVSNSFGFRQWLALADIERVTMQKFWMHPCMRIVAREGKVYWLMRETVRLDEMHAAIVAQSGAQHPLAVALSTPLYALK